jgi:succinyl-diaminopimelate desuccinylase
MNYFEPIKMSELKRILSELISFPSITPDDAGCQEFMIQFLRDLGFNCEQMNQGPVSNFFAVYGNKGPCLMFAGHTDVVPIGDETKWLTDPFVLVEKDNMLYGRGTADMKGSLAAMMLAAKRFIQNYPNFPGRLVFLITSGEEGEDYDLGTPYVMKQLESQQIHIDYCVIGEPSSTHHVGDVIKIGRRGSLHAQINLQGKQGHVAYPHLAENPIHKMSQALAQLTSIVWDEGNDYFPPTSMQITYLHSGGHAGNMIPGELVMHLNFRYSTEQTQELLKNKVSAVFNDLDLHPNIQWRLSGEPFLTTKGALLESIQQTVLEQTGITPELSTSGGTSDGRFIAPYGIEVIELGPVNATIHQVNECVSLIDLYQLEAHYFSICQKLLLTFK